MNIQELLNLKTGTKLKCVYPYKDKFQEEKTYEIEDFNLNGNPTIFAKEGDFLPYVANGLLNDGRLIVCFGSECAIFEIIEDEAEETTNSGNQDYNIGDKLTCVKSWRYWFAEGKEYPIDALKITADGLHFVYIKDDDGNSTGIDVTSSNGLHADDCRFVKSDSIKKPTPDVIMDSLLEDGPHFAAVSDFFKNPTEYSEVSYALIVSTNDKSDYRFVDTNGEQWKYAVAVDNRGKEITEL